MNFFKKGYGFGLFKRLKRGDRFYIFLTFRCTQFCEYCTNRAYNGEIPVCNIIRLDEWKKIIENHPVKIREVVITGGEPTLHPDFSELVDWLIDQGYYVTIFSNLGTLIGLGMKSSRRIRIAATWHRSADLVSFLGNRESYARKYRVDVMEIETDRIPHSAKSPMFPCASHYKYFTEVPCEYSNSQCCLRQRIVNCYMPYGKMFKTVLEGLKDAHSRQ